MSKVLLNIFACLIVFFELYIFLQIYNVYFEKKQLKVHMDSIVLIISYILLCIINILSNNAIELFVFSFIVYLLLVCLNYICRVWQSFVLNILMWCVGIGSETLTFAAIAFIYKKEFLDIAVLIGSPLWIFSSTLSKLIMLIFIKIIIKFHSTKVNKIWIPFKFWIAIMCVPVSSVLLLFFSLDFFLKANNISLPIMLIFSILVLFVNAIIFSIIEEIYRQTDSKVENIMLKHQLSAQIEHYNQLKVNDERIMSIIHDTKNTLFCLEKMLEQQQYNTALCHIKNTLGEIVENYDSVQYTSNPILDAFLNEKFRIAKNSNIRLQHDIDNLPQFKMNIIDLCLLLGNSLDNAIEACNKRESFMTASIDVNLLLSQNNLKIEITNSIFENIIKSNTKLHTSKKDSDLHGYGLKNIEKIVEKYNGNMAIAIHANTFVFGVILPKANVFV